VGGGGSRVKVAVEEGGRREEWTVNVQRAQQVCIYNRIGECSTGHGGAGVFGHSVHKGKGPQSWSWSKISVSWRLGSQLEAHNSSSVGHLDGVARPGFASCKMLTTPSFSQIKRGK